jgi:hypothetical protein
MDKHTNLKGMVSSYKTPQWTNLLCGVLYLDTIPFKLVSLSIVGILYLDTIPFKLVSLSIVGFYIWIPLHTNLKGMVSRYKNPHNGQTY